MAIRTPAMQHYPTPPRVDPQRILYSISALGFFAFSTQVVVLKQLTWVAPTHAISYLDPVYRTLGPFLFVSPILRLMILL